MFFGDPAAAFANIRSLLAPSGRLAFTCWRDVFSNEWMLLAGMAVTSVTGSLPPMPGPGEPGPMSLADPDVVNDLLSGAGFTDIEITPFDHLIDRPESDVESFVAMARQIGPVGGALRESDDEQFDDRLLAAVRAALHEKVTNGRLQLTAAANIVSARA
jgi:SAM-dependent methyltransferase